MSEERRLCRSGGVMRASVRCIPRTFERVVAGHQRLATLMRRAKTATGNPPRRKPYGRTIVS
jgi:hypothetical protein